MSDALTGPQQRIQHNDPHRPHLVALPGCRESGYTEDHGTSTRPTYPALPAHIPPVRQHRRQSGIQRTMYVLIAASLLLTVGISALIGYNLWLKQTQVAHDPNGIVPPADLQQGPIPA